MKVLNCLAIVFVALATVISAHPKKDEAIERQKAELNIEQEAVMDGAKDHAGFLPEEAMREDTRNTVDQAPFKNFLKLKRAKRVATIRKSKCKVQRCRDIFDRQLIRIATGMEKIPEEKRKLFLRLNMYRRALMDVRKEGQEACLKQIVDAVQKLRGIEAGEEKSEQEKVKTVGPNEIKEHWRNGRWLAACL